MPFCRNCGKEIDKTNQFCPYCGADTAAPKAAPKIDVENIMDTPEVQIDPQDAADNKWLALIGYLGILFLVPLLAAPKSEFARFHANQSLILFIASAVLGIAVSIVSWIPLIGWLVSLVASVLPLVFIIIGMINAYNEKAKELPFIGQYRILK